MQIKKKLLVIHACWQEQEVAPTIASFWEKAEFPHHLVPKLAKLNLGGGVLHGHGCPGQSIMGAAIANVEIARVDGSMSTFLMVHNSLAMLTLGASQAAVQALIWPVASTARCLVRYCINLCSFSARQHHKLVLGPRPCGVLRRGASSLAGLLGSEQQKQELLPRMASLEWTGAWALTEPSNGSDASALQSTARKARATPHHQYSLLSSG